MPTQNLMSVRPSLMAQTLPPSQELSVPKNRVHMVLAHVPFYGFEGQARLARDAGVCRSTISRLISGRAAPSLRLAQAVTAAIALRLGRPLETTDLFSPDGTYRQPSACALCGCRGCLPEATYDSKGNRKPAWKSARPGDWSRSPQVPQAATC